MIIGNAVGIGFALLQQHFHLIKLDPETYYMPYVPISLSITQLIALNIAIIAISYITLIIPSRIIASIRPATTLRYE